MTSKFVHNAGTVRRVVLLATVAGVPLVFLRSLNDPIAVPKVALLFGGVTIAAGLRAIESIQGRDLRPLRRLLVPSGFLGIPIVAAWAASPYRAWASLGEYQKFQGALPYLAVIVLGILCADAFAGRSHQILWAIAGSAGVAAAYALLQVAGLDPFPWDFVRVGTSEPTRDAISTFGNENFSGAFFAIALPGIMALWILDPGRRKMTAATFVVVGAALIATRSFGPWAAAAAGTFVVLGFQLARRRPTARILGVVAAAVVAGVVVGSVLFAILFPGSRFSTPTTRTRGDWWQASAAMAADAPIVGHGPNSFSLIGARYRPPEDAVIDGYRFSDDPHSVLFALLGGTGVPGAFGFIAIAGWATYRALRSPGILSGAFLGASAAYYVSSLVSIDEIALRVALWASLGGLAVVAASPEARAVTKKSRRSSGSKVKTARVHGKEPLRAPRAVAGIAVLIAGALAGTTFFVVVDAKVEHATDLFVDRRFAEGKQEFRSATALRDDPYYRRMYGFWTGEAAKEEARAAEQDGSAGSEHFSDLPEIFDYLDSLPDRQGIELYTRYLRAWAEFNPAANRLARRWLLRLVTLDPLNPYLRIDAAAVLTDLGDARAAIDVLRPAIDVVERSYPGIEVPPDLRASVWGHLGLAQARTGLDNEARQAVARALALASDQPQALRAREILGGS